MKKLCTNGFKISSVDQKALDHYLLTTPKEWAEAGLKGMINKAVKSIMRDWFDTYKAKQAGNIQADISKIIPGIIAMEEFRPFNEKAPLIPVVEREEETTQEIWEGGFDVEDYEKQALDAFYEAPEEMLRYFMENKVYQRRKAFVRENEPMLFKDAQVKEIPAKQEDFINMVCNKQGYKNRKQRETEVS